MLPMFPFNIIAALLHFRLPYPGIFGGATILNHEHMKTINGFPNVFFGWGGEDDNIAGR